MNPSFERSPDTDRVITALRGVNQEVTYGDLAKLASLSTPRTKAVLTSARRALRKEKILFGTIVGYGLKRLNDEDKVGKSEANKKRMMRAAGRAIKEIETIQAFDRLSPSNQVVVTTNRTIFAMTRQHLTASPKAAPPQPTEAPSTNTENLIAMRKGRARP